MMKQSVCFVMPNMSGGGAQRVVSVLANGLAAENWDVTIYLTNDDLLEYQLDESIHIDSSSCYSRHNAVDQIRNIRKKMRSHPNTVFVSFLDNQNVFTILSGLGMRNRVVVSQRNDPHRAYQDRPYMRGISRFLFRYADRAVFQTQDALDYYPKNMDNKYQIILNPINESLPDPFEGERSYRIVTVCRLNKQKNLPLAIDAFKEFVETHTDYVFEIYGKGELERSLKDYVSKDDLTDKVLFKGFRSDVHNCIRDAAMFVISSDYEGLSNAMLESMAMGIPTIATDCPIGGARMVIKNKENGILVPVGDIESLRNAMCCIADDHELAKKISKNSRNIREDLSSEKIINQWISILSFKE